MTLGLYTDDDTGLLGLAEQAAARGAHVLRSDEAGMRGQADIEHLRYASAHDLVLVTCNRRDFLALHWEFLGRGERHAGIIIVHQTLPKGERIRRLLHLCSVAEPADFASRVEFLSDWG